MSADSVFSSQTFGLYNQQSSMTTRRRRFWQATHGCVAPYVDIILHRGRFWAKSAASGSGTVYSCVENEDVWSSKLELPLVARNANAG